MKTEKPVKKLALDLLALFNAADDDGSVLRARFWEALDKVNQHDIQTFIDLREWAETDKT